MRRALLIAFHFPPASGTSGVHRARSLARYLPDLGWEPIVLTASARAHPIVRHEADDGLPPSLEVYRSFALDTARHLSLHGRYPEFLAWPDRWISWYPAAVRRGVSLVRKLRPDIIWSTYPIVTSQLIAMKIAERTGLPWVADFRDSMTDEDYPPAGKRRDIIVGVERRTVTAASAVSFTAPGTLDMYAARYPELPTSKWHLILNGYDEESFRDAERRSAPRRNAKTIIVHSGVIYPEERDPTALFTAIAELRERGIVSEATFELRLRAPGHESIFEPEIERLGIADVVSLKPSIPYDQALAEMLEADGLLLLQAPSCNHQIPAKLYEYARARRPVLALTDTNGDTARLLRKLAPCEVAPLDDPASIAETLTGFLRKISADDFTPAVADVADYSREAQAARTSHLFDTVLSEHGKMT